MIMETQTRSRPNLEVRTDYVDDFDEIPKPAFRNHHSVLPSISPLTERPSPNPVQPATPGYDVLMRQHERAGVESFEGRARQGSLGGAGRPVWMPMSPIAEQKMTEKVGLMKMESPSKPQEPFQGTRSQSIVAETRSMLLSGMPASQANDLGTVSNRRVSVVTAISPRGRRQSLALLQPDLLQEFGHVYLGDPAKADVFVAPTSLRRRNSGNGQSDGIEGNQLVIQARVRPKTKDRKPFVLTRSFDLDQLRTTIPSTPTTPSSSRRQSVVQLSSEDLSNLARTPTTPRTPLTPLGSDRRRSSATASGNRVGDYQSKRRSSSITITKELPVHLAYARSYMPALAALMLSGHVKTGDSIDLPMPHPEVWPQTLAYVYTGSGELSKAVEQNVLHLGGRL